MSGTFTPFAPQNGQLPSSQGPIATCPNGTNYYLKQFWLFNSGVAVETIQIWLQPNGGTARHFGPQIQLAPNESAQILEDGESITLTALDAVLAATTNASAVDYTITGVQET